jgi:hypothetical protein
MSTVEWFQVVELIRPHVVRISTPRGSGTGFLLSHAKNLDLISIATAAHVINHAHYWEEPIRFTHADSGKSLLIRDPERAVFIDEDRDTAAILVAKGDLPVPTDAFPLGPKGMHLRVGNEIGWLGFPAIANAGLAFFSGRISAWMDSSYLVDGVAINGVSGGPAFHLASGAPTIVGVVSAYVPNRATGETLPGLAVVTDVAHFHDVVERFATLDQAKEQETPPSPPGPEPDGSGKSDGPTLRTA